MKLIFGVLLVLAGLALGVWLGLWVMFVGGIISLVHAFQANPVNASHVAWAVARIFFASLVGYLAAACLVIPGFVCIGTALD